MKDLENYIIDSNVKLNMNNYSQKISYAGRIQLPTLTDYSTKLRIPIITLVGESFVLGLKEIDPNWDVTNLTVQIRNLELSDDNDINEIDNYCDVTIKFESYNSSLIKAIYLKNIELDKIIFKGMEKILNNYTNISDEYFPKEIQLLISKYDVNNNDEKIDLNNIKYNPIKVALNKITTYLKNKQIKYSIKLVDSPNEQLILVNILFDDNDFEYDAKIYLDNIRYGIEKEFIISDLPIIFDISSIQMKEEERSEKMVLLEENKNI